MQIKQTILSQYKSLTMLTGISTKEAKYKLLITDLMFLNLFLSSFIIPTIIKISTTANYSILIIYKKVETYIDLMIE